MLVLTHLGIQRVQHLRTIETDEQDVLALRLDCEGLVVHRPYLRPSAAAAFRDSGRGARTARAGPSGKPRGRGRASRTAPGPRARRACLPPSAASPAPAARSAAH